MIRVKYSKNDVTYPKGFKANGIHCGIKKDPKKCDLGVILTDETVNVSGVFTKNKFIAAPILDSKTKILKYKKTRAVVVNSGNANACCGKNGEKGLKEVLNSFSKSLKIKTDEILTFSTGSIGKILPYNKINKNVKKITENASKKNGKLFSKSIMTTDAFMKTCSCEIKYNDKIIRIGASAKGAGMIAPNMATMLCFISTDADISYNLLNSVLKDSVSNTFNRISVDDDMSTNDSVILLASGASKVKISSKNDLIYKAFKQAVLKICQDLAYMIVKDGEGASKVIHVNVTGAKTFIDAKKVCKSIATSLLLKCAMFGSTANWGRIVSSIGASSAFIDPLKIKVSLQKTLCFYKNEPNLNAINIVKPLMKKKDIFIDVDLNVGKYSYDMKASDLGYEYVSINKD